MSSYSDLMFGQIAVKLGLTTEERLRECVGLQEERQALGTPVGLGELFVERGFLEAAQVEQVLGVQRRSAVAEEDKVYGEIAVKNGFLGREQVAASLEAQKQQKFAIRIGQLLLDRGHLSLQQHNAILKAQERVMDQRQTQFLVNFSRRYFGEVATEQQYVRVDDVEAGLARQKAQKDSGTTVRRLGEVLVEDGRMNDAQVEAVLDIASGKVPKNLIPGFRITELLGKGAMGVVFKAVQERLRRPVALKILLPSLAEDKDFIRRFIREAQTTARFNHPNIVQVYDVGQHQKYYYIAMEFIVGTSCAERLKAGEVLPEEEAVGIALQVARALEVAEKHGIVHRDVKPDNILLASDGVAKLCDLGLSRQSRKSEQGQSITLTQQGMALGTPAYMSPEQAQGIVEVDTRSDIYSLGASLYHMVTGLVPYHDSQSAIELVSRHLTDPPPDPLRVRPELKRDLAYLVTTMMAKNPADRYPGAASLIEDLEKLQRGQVLRPIGKTGPKRKVSRRR
ncbi:MAG: serine/threonine protein kinase [Planctomycetes bacterium]|nr:serine/threonine protein kinase [Planctomycetota bacterium]